MVEKQMLASALELCIALQQNKDAGINELLPRLEEELSTADNRQALKSLKNVLATALRKRNYSLFQQIVYKYTKSLNALISRPELKPEGQDFINFLAFNICDRRLHKEREPVEEFTRSVLATANQEEMIAFINEWSSLVARFARRGWLNETNWLLKNLLEHLWIKQNPKLVQVTLWQLQLNMTMKCSYDGFVSTFKTYRLLFYSFLVVIDYTERYWLDNRGEQWLQLILRSLRDLVIQLARVQMQEPEELFHQLSEVWLQDLKLGMQAGEESEKPIWKRTDLGTKKLEERVQRTLQMAITYWSLTNPKSSKKQLVYLQDLMEPRKITPECKKLLKKLS